MLNQKINAFNKSTWPEVEKLIKKSLFNKGESPITKDIINHHLESPGKHIRPFFTTELYSCFKDNDKYSYPLAAASELLHNATLIHDDIEDGDESRRGHTSLWNKYNVAQAINAGDFYFTGSIDAILSSDYTEIEKIEILRIMTSTCYTLTDGQIMDIGWQNVKNIDIDYYKKMSKGKSGALFYLIIKGALLLTDIKENDGAIHSLADSIGLLYQMRDDLLDYIGKKEGRNENSDLLEGRLTFLAALAVENLPKNKTKNLLDLLKKIDKNEKTVMEIRKLYENLSIKEKALEYMQLEAANIKKNPVARENKKTEILFENLTQYLMRDLK